MSFKQFLTESRGLGYSQARGSVARPKKPKYDGEWNGDSIHIDHALYDERKNAVDASATKHGVSLKKSTLDSKNLEVVGSKEAILKFLVAQGWNASDAKKWYKL